MENSNYKYDIFISYSRKDKSVAEQICTTLQKQGISFFIDRKGIGGGMEFPAVLAEAIQESHIILFLASKNSYSSKFTNKEITFAFNEKPSGTLLPYIIDGSTLPPSLRFTFADINIRTIQEHPINTILMEDLCQLLGREHRTDESIQQEKLKAENELRAKIEQEYQKRMEEKEKDFREKMDAMITKTRHRTREIAKERNYSENYSETEKDSNPLWAFFALLSPVIMLGIGIWYGIEVQSFWKGFEMFIIPSWVFFFIFLGLSLEKKTDTIAFSGVSLLGVAVFAGIHAADILNSTGWGIFIGVAIAITSLYIFFKYI